MAIYNENIPQPTDTLDQSQSDLLANFQAIKQLIDVDHGTFGSSEEGTHIKLTIPDSGGVPSFSGTDIGIYANVSTFTSKNELFMRPSDGGTDFPWTGKDAATQGWTYLPSGILLKWGTAPSNGDSTFVFPLSPDPAFTELFSVQVTTVNTSTSDTDMFVRLRAFIPTQIQTFGSPRTTIGSKATTYHYLAIGI